MRPIYYPDLQKHFPMRSPAWRFERSVCLLADDRQYSPRNDDELTGRALNFLRDQDDPGRRRCQGKLAARYAAIEAAFQLHNTDDKAKLLAEASMLARRSSRQIAAATGTLTETIEIYEGLFYDVRDHLGARDWILANAIHGGHSDQPDERAVLFKSFAYFGGSAVLDAVAPYLIHGKNLFEPAPDLSTVAARRKQRVRLAVAAHLMRLNQRTSIKLFQVLQMLQETERKPGKSCSPGAIFPGLISERPDDAALDVFLEQFLAVTPAFATPVPADVRQAG